MPDKDNFIAASPLAPLIAQFLYREEPKINFQRLTEAVRLHCGNVDASHLPSEGSGMAQYFMTDVLAEFKDNVRLPSQLCLCRAESAPNLEILAASLSQTRSWQGAQEVATSCRHMLLANDLMAGPLSPQVRNKQFRGFVRAIQETLPADAIHFMNSQIVVNPQDFLHQQAGPKGAEMTGSINVRLFRIEGTDGDCLMDTMGLAVLGLPDIQCHFKGLDCSRMASKLHDVAIYLFEKGDVVKDGETIEGFDPVQRWKCQHEMALVKPERVVLDVNPGPPFAIGGRN